MTNVTLQQPYDMGSAYNNPKYTNFTTGFAACLDYIFYETNKLRVMQVCSVIWLLVRICLILSSLFSTGGAVAERRGTETVGGHSVPRVPIGSYFFGGRP